MNETLELPIVTEHFEKDSAMLYNLWDGNQIPEVYLIYQLLLF